MTHLTDLELSLLLAEHAFGYRWYRSTRRHTEPRRFLGDPDITQAAHPAYPAALLELASPTDAIHPDPYHGPHYASSAEGATLLTERLADLGLEHAHQARSAELRAELGPEFRRRAAALAALDLLGVPRPLRPLLERCFTCFAANHDQHTCHDARLAQPGPHPDGPRTVPLRIPDLQTFGCVHYHQDVRRVFPEQFLD